MDEALRAMATVTDDRPDVILTDIGLPGMSGIDGIAALRKQFARPSDPGAHGVRQRRQGVRRAVRGGIRIPPEEHAAGATVGIAPGSGQRRRTHVA